MRPKLHILAIVLVLGTVAGAQAVSIQLDAGTFRVTGWQAPVRTFVPYTLGGEPYVLAAYTCTPLVKIPVSALKPGAQVKGVTIADLGSGNQPLDMVPYKKDGHDFILIANTTYGVVKLHADTLATDKPIDSPTVVDVAGAPYDKISTLTNVRHLARVDDGHALVVSATPGNTNLQTIALP